MKLAIVAMFIAAIPATITFAQAKQARSSTMRHQQEMTFQPEGENAEALNYLLYVPADYKRSRRKKYPLMLFLHGAGERGDNLAQVARHGPPMLVEQGKKLPFIIVSPQCPKGKWWNPSQLGALLDDVQSKLRVDEDQVYCTGLSMGGFGTWALAAQFPDRFAAIAPICGGGNPQSAEKIKHLPICVFHGDADKTVKIAKSQEMVDALKAAGAENVKFTIYPGVGHNSWSKAYADDNLYRWMLSHKRPKKEDDKAK